MNRPDEPSDAPAPDQEQTDKEAAQASHVAQERINGPLETEPALDFDAELYEPPMSDEEIKEALEEED